MNSSSNCGFAETCIITYLLNVNPTVSKPIIELVFDFTEYFYDSNFSHNFISLFYLSLITQSITEIKNHRVGGGLGVESGGNMTTLDGERWWESGGYLIRQESKKLI